MDHVLHVVVRVSIGFMWLCMVLEITFGHSMSLYLCCGERIPCGQDTDYALARKPTLPPSRPGEHLAPVVAFSVSLPKLLSMA